MALQKSESLQARKWRNFFLEAGTLVGAILIGLVLRFGVYETIVVISGSMEPTIQIQERFLVDHRPILSNRWRRGDVVIFDTPASWEGDEGDTLVKRVVGLPGDRVELQGSQVFINGSPLVEDFVHPDPMAESVGPINLGADEYFVLGDNRSNSADSSEYGPVKNALIRGRVAMRIWPLNKFGRLPRAYTE